MEKTDKIAIIKAAVERRAKEAKERAEAERKARAARAPAKPRERAREERSYVTVQNGTQDDIQRLLVMKEAAIKTEEGIIAESKDSLLLARNRLNELKAAGIKNEGLKGTVEYLERKVKLHEKLLAKAKAKEYRLPKRYVPRYQNVPREDFLQAVEEQNAIGYFSIEQTCIAHNMSRQAVSHRIKLGLIVPHVVGPYKFISHDEMTAATETIKEQRSVMAANLKKSVAD